MFNKPKGRFSWFQQNQENRPHGTRGTSFVSGLERLSTK